MIEPTETEAWRPWITLLTMLQIARETEKS